ncbi:hypothetical protein B0H17DRAFT_1195917 [Mycena rosella]|uniref:DUF6699 domain-containing protein n=1 Tax=Mycena rosella TaxID=1033263 RepID=A0AAD7GL50_MYCRO|nr:hypothetical protein B0H17DRAFT_1195917 [Mycena rosella]
MHVPQSTPYPGSPLSYVSGKLSQRGQPSLEWTRQHPPAPTATPWMQCVPLPHLSTPVFQDSSAVYKPTGHSSTYYPGPFAPSMPPVPLPHLNQPSSISSSSRHTSHSSRSSHTSSSHTYSSLHPLLSSQTMTFPISSYPFDARLICVPTNLQHKFCENAFSSALIKIKLCGDEAINPLVVQNLGSLSVAMILKTLHEHLHTLISRDHFTALHQTTRRIAQASNDERCACANRRVPMKMLDVLGFGAKDVIFIGLTKGIHDEWVPSFTVNRNA